MSRLTQAKVALALVGLMLFGTGVRFQEGRLRLVGIAVVAAAWSLRFVRPKGPR
ncbi:MAG TPA: hypothetical protein VF981_01605 [Gemmatimonadaceae bacterium]